MIDHEAKLETGVDVTKASDASTVLQPTPNSADATGVKSTTHTPINPDDLHDLFEGTPTGDGTDEEDPLAQLRNDPNYAALIRDLEYIAEAARELFATQEEAPSDNVWAKIQGELKKNPED